MYTQTHGDVEIVNGETEPLLPRAKTPSAVAESTVNATPAAAEAEVEAEAAAVDNVLDATLSLHSEARIMLNYGGPLILTYLLQFFFQFYIVLVAARFSTDELAGVSLGLTTANIIGYAILEGMATALDTLCPQAYGAGRLPDVGLHTLRFTIFVNLAAIPIILLWVFSPTLLARVVASPAVATHAGAFLRSSALGIPGYATFEAGKRFMQAQGNFRAGLAVLIACIPLNLGLTHAFVALAPAGQRVGGAALATAVGNLARPGLLALYAAVVEPRTLQCWPAAGVLRRGEWLREGGGGGGGGWSAIARLAFPGALMTLSAWLAYEALTFCTNYVGVEALAAQTFLGTTAQLAWHIPFAASMACSTRIGHLVGAGAVDAARRVIRWYQGVFVGLGVFNMGLAWALLAAMVRFLVGDADVARIVWACIPFAAVYVFFDVMCQWITAPLRAFGWQDVGAWCNLSINYLVGVPLALYLELGPPGMVLRGMWTGLASGMAIVFAVETAWMWVRLRRIRDKTAAEDG